MDAVDIIFFDAGGTLLYPEPGIGEAYSRAGQRYGVSAGPGETELAFIQAYSEAQVASRYQDRAVHSAVGCSVTLKWMTRRRSWLSTMKQNSTRNVTVGTVKKSMAAI